MNQVKNSDAAIRNWRLQSLCQIREKELEATELAEVCQCQICKENFDSVKTIKYSHLTLILKQKRQVKN